MGQVDFDYKHKPRKEDDIEKLLIEIVNFELSRGFDRERNDNHKKYVEDNVTCNICKVKYQTSI
jgi:hypothetical protein